MRARFPPPTLRLAPSVGIGRMASLPKRTIASFFQPVTAKKAKPGVGTDDGFGVAKTVTAQLEDCDSGNTDSAGSEGVRIPAGGPGPTPRQLLRSVANKNMALAKRAVKQAALQNEALKLSELLVEPSWKGHMGAEFDKPYMEQLQKFLQQEWAGREAIFPPQPFIFRAYNTVPFDKIKVVILGQDPYHGPGQAVGLCFSVPDTAKRPSSLLNMYKELNTDCGCRIVSHGNLETWATQGVLMLNTVLTVRAHQANSHARKGWEAFTDETIKRISASRTGVVFLLWGKQAQDKERLIDVTRHHVLKSAHPSGLSAHRGFFGCKHFSQTNRILQEQGLEGIDWQV